MTDETKRNDDPQASQQPGPDAPAESAAAQGSAADNQAALVAAAEELRDKYLRAVAEMENIRKRAERETAEARAYGITLFARDVLGVGDNLTRALEAISPEARANADATLKALLEGVELTSRELYKALEKHGIRQIDPKGEKFNPHFHQAMFEVPDAEAAPGTVVQVMQTGYAIGDRILRPAMVAVAKEANKPAQESAPAEDAGKTG